MKRDSKVAIVTGTASGIGKEIARELLAHGARVAIANLNLEQARAAAKELDPSRKQALAMAAIRS